MGLFRVHLRLALLGGAAVILAVAVSACGDGGAREAGAVGPVHVHGLGINPADDALFIAAHTGLFRAPPGSRSVERVDDQFQDTMGFTVVGPDHFLASGHPAPGQSGPPSLGLIESSDGGESWQNVSLAGEADFHVLRYAHNRVYAYDALTGNLMLSDDGGGSWRERPPPAAVIDIAVDPDDPERIVTSTERGLAVSEDGGRSWRPLRGDVGLLAWPASRRLYLIDGAGRVQVSAGARSRWRTVGTIDGQPAALAASGSQNLYAALSDGTVLASGDSGASWNIRSRP